MVISALTIAECTCFTFGEEALGGSMQLATTLERITKCGHIEAVNPQDSSATGTSQLPIHRSQVTVELGKDHAACSNHVHKCGRCRIGNRTSPARSEAPTP